MNDNQNNRFRLSSNMEASDVLSRVQQMVVVGPVEADVGKTQLLAQEDGPQRQHSLQLITGWNFDFQHPDGDNTVAKGLETGLIHSA